MIRKTLVLGLLLGIIFSLGVVSAQIVGCCFNPSDGLCAENTEMELCQSAGGEFFESKTCPTVEKCQKGCCSLGSSSTFVSKRECQLLSNEYQFDFPANFAAITEKECTDVAETASTEYGACVFKVDYPPYKCKYTTKANCVSPDFFAGVLCSAEELNTTCKTTTDKTMCFATDGSNEDVYVQDSCGNPDRLSKDCNYAKGNNCGVYRNGIDSKPKNGNLICRNLNCVDNKGKELVNGHSQCINEDPNKVGSRSARQFCINGNLITEPCEDFRREICAFGENENGEVKCVNNDWSACFSTNGTSNDSCGDSCYLFGKYSKYNNRTFEASIKNCDTGNINDFEPNRYPIELDCNAETNTYNVSILSSTDTQTAVENATKTPNMCMPKTPGGLQFYKKQTSNTSSSSTDTATSTCSKGSFEAKATLTRRINLISHNLALNLASPVSLYNMWNVYEKLGTWQGWNRQAAWAELGGIASLHINRITDVRSCNDGGDSSYCAYFNEVNWWKNLSITSAPELLDYLNKKCRAIGDCDGKANIIEVKGINNLTNKTGFGYPPFELTKYLGDFASDIAPSYRSYLEKFSNGTSVNGSLNPQKLSWTNSQTTNAFSIGSSGLYNKVEREWSGNYKISFTCEPWQAPDSDKDCSKCGTDGMVCSEYRCKSLGQKCDYYEKEGIGYCERSTDNTAPVISCTSKGCPKTAIKPYTPFEFSIKTNEASECKFNFNYAGGKYSEMKYAFGKDFSTEHKIILTPPGQNKQVITNESNTTEYSLLKEGKGTLYIRCVDATGNGEVNAPFLIPFEVMKTPDGNSPVILEAKPKSGDKIPFNTTEKVVDFKLNEPSECNWDTSDVEYTQMNHSMICDTDVSEFGTIFGYTCSARFTNITTYLGAESKFYVRCKDQPYLEGNEDDLYKRNTNYKSYELVLRPSEKLEIIGFAPTDILKKGTENQSLEMVMTTKGGALSGKAECFWRSGTSNNSVFVRFLITNSNAHKQPITRPVSGINIFEIKCQDEVGNMVRQTFNFTLLIDENYPSVSRMFEATKNIKVKTDEESKCYYTNNDKLGCAFDINNATQMSGDKKEHTIAWLNDKTFYIKCKDSFGNYNKDCGVIIKTY